jgi:hypothetical protein
MAEQNNEIGNFSLVEVQILYNYVKTLAGSKNPLPIGDNWRIGTVDINDNPIDTLSVQGRPNVSSPWVESFNFSIKNV